jgi:hypothetical protein
MLTFLWVVTYIIPLRFAVAPFYKKKIIVLPYSNAGLPIQTKQILYSLIGIMNIHKITFGNGCFWCTEAIFETLKGVKSLASGYMGGHIENPTYKDVCTGNTRHA